MSAMDVDVSQTKVTGDHATADVVFRAKSAAAQGASMQFEYSLEKRGAEWVVVSSQAGDGAMNHPSAAAPPGHPAIDGSAKSPSGHSSFSDIMDSTQSSAQPTQTPATPSEAPAGKP